MTSFSRFNVFSLAIAIPLIACGGREATSTIGAADGGAPRGSVPSPGANGDSSAIDYGDDGGGRDFGDDGSYDLPPVVAHNGPGPDGLDAGSLMPGVCPDSLPATGGACDVAGTRCSYGNSVSPFISCRDWVSCSGGAWAPEPKDDTKCGAFAPKCAADRAEDLLHCTVDCHFDDGTYCICGGGSEPTYCVTPTPGADCPAFLPNQGTLCSSNARCSYGLPNTCGGSSAYASCLGGVWITASMVCHF